MTRFASGIFVFVAAISALALSNPIPVQLGGGGALMTKSKPEIPKSIQFEHEAIHSGLIEATQLAGRVGAAAKALAEVLHPHFVREEQIALPPLGLLAPLAAGRTLPDTEAFEALTMADTLRRELPKMLDEHKGILAAIDKLRRAAGEEQALKYRELADQLALHAQTEEEVLYPAAILVGDLIRSKRSKN